MDWKTADLEGRRQDKEEAEKTNIEEGTTRMGGREEDRQIRIGEDLRGQEVERDDDKQIKSGYHRKERDEGRQIRWDEEGREGRGRVVGQGGERTGRGEG